MINATDVAADAPTIPYFGINTAARAVAAAAAQAGEYTVMIGMPLEAK